MLHQKQLLLLGGSGLPALFTGHLRRWLAITGCSRSWCCSGLRCSLRLLEVFLASRWSSSLRPPRSGPLYSGRSWIVRSWLARLSLTTRESAAEFWKYPLGGCSRSHPFALRDPRAFRVLLTFGAGGSGADSSEVVSVSGSSVGTGFFSLR